VCRGIWEKILGYNSRHLKGKKLTDVKLMSGEIVKVDSCIASLVQILNDYKIKTRYSCCGHGALSNSGIIIDEKNIEIHKHPTVIELIFPYPGDKKARR